MTITSRAGVVVSVSEARLEIVVRDRVASADVAFHWTSFWSAWPGQRPVVGDLALIVCDGDRPIGFKLDRESRG